MTKANTGRMAGKVALVTGAGSGIGKAAALQFAREGAAVALVGRRKEPLAEVAASIAGAGGRALALPADMANEAAVEQVIAETQDRLGPLDAAFNNAAILGAYKPIVEMTADEFYAVIATNYGACGCWRAPRSRR